LTDDVVEPPLADIISTNRNVYDGLASVYEDRALLHVTATRQRVEQLISLLKASSRVIDVGCGVGLALSFFREAGMMVTGVELSEKMASYTRMRNPRANIIVGDFLTLELSSDYDLVFAQSFIHLFPKSMSGTVISKLVNMLKPNGFLAVSTDLSYRSGQAWGRKADYPGHPKRYKRTWTREELRLALVSSGCSVVDEFTMPNYQGRRFLEVTVQRSPTSC
jgi:SAM-dependent methyltransferase